MKNFLVNKIKRTFRIRHIIACFKAFISETQIVHQMVNKKTMLIIRMDAIGDYILFRNFLEEIRASQTYHGYKIILCGNQLWSTIAEEFDKNYVDEFIWIQKHRFINDKQYRKSMLSQISDLAAEVAICPNAARDFLVGDSLIRASGSSVRVGSASTRTIDPWVVSKLGEQFYTTLIDNRDPPFEFDKTKLFFETFLRKKISLIRPYINLPREQIGKKIVIMPGAGEPARQWNTENFIVLIRSLLLQYNHDVYLAGSVSDQPLAKKIVSGLNNSRVFDLTGKTELPELIRLIANSQLLIAHDSGGLHIGVATNTNTVGLMTGKHYMRFGPYSHHPDNLKLIFPEEEAYYKRLYDKYGTSYFEDVFSDINLINSSTVLNECIQLLTNEIPAHR